MLLGSCTEKYLGHRFANPEDDSVILIFDDAGFIAGSQSVVPASVADASVMARNPAYQVSWKKLSLQVYKLLFQNIHSSTNGLRWTLT